MRTIICLALLTLVSSFKSVVQVTCPPSCSNCQCKSCKNITVPLGKCSAAGQGAGVIGSCSKDGSKFTEDIYLNAKCQGQSATRSVVNTDACIQASETKKYIAFFCSNAVAEERIEKPKVFFTIHTWHPKANLTSSTMTKKYHYGDPASGCKSDEIGGSLTGLENYQACYPKCLQYNDCPTDLPGGAVAGPGNGNAYGLCLLNAPKPEYSKHCMLMCKGVFGEGTCPAPSVCVDIPGYEFSLCQYPAKSGQVVGNSTARVLV